VDRTSGLRMVEPSRRQVAADRWWIVLALCWAIVVSLGFCWIWSYKLTPGSSAGAVPPSWPAASRMARPTGRPTLILFAHPQCVCTRASVHELARLVAPFGSRLDTRVNFVLPSGVEDGFERSDTWESAQSIPGVTVATDPDGREAELFQATTSGFVVLYSADGRLLFRGGITSSRGHEGTSDGAERIAALLRGERPTARGSPVFGCRLADRVPERPISGP